VATHQDLFGSFPISHPISQLPQEEQNRLIQTVLEAFLREVQWGGRKQALSPPAQRWMSQRIEEVGASSLPASLPTGKQI
jgi:hypothetical protein